MERPDERVINLLLVVSVLCAVFGVAMMVFGGAVVDLLSMGALNQSLWGGPPPEIGLPADRWAHQTVGALIAPFALCMGAITHVPLRRGEPWAWNTMMLAATSWYFFTAVATAMVGCMRLLVTDAAFLAMYVAPLLWLRRQPAATVEHGAQRTTS